MAAGRNCPLNYQYGAAAIAACPEQVAETLYIVGGLYGNLPALAAIETMAGCEQGQVTLCFNGDFNWFNVDHPGYLEVNRRVLANDAALGNVEAELFAPGDEAGCGCAYPEHVEADVVDRSNRIHARLKQTARAHSEILAALARLPKVRRYRIGAVVAGIVHGDAESLAGWRFDAAALDDAANRSWIDEVFALASVDLFASSHTCLPVVRHFDRAGARLVVNNGAAGMPNFRSDRRGLITRIGIRRSPHAALYSEQLGGVHVSALPVPFDEVRWQQDFLRNWPAGSPAHVSYFERMVHGPDHGPAQAYPSPLSRPFKRDAALPTRPTPAVFDGREMPF